MSRVREHVDAFWASDFFWMYRRSPVAVVSSVVALICVFGAVLAPWIAPHTPNDLGTVDLMDGFRSPIFGGNYDPRFLLGTDDQGRDMLSSIMYGARISLMVGFSAMLLSTAIGIVAGLTAGYVGGIPDSVLMRIADIQLTFPPILIALLIDGLSRLVIARDVYEDVAIYAVIFAIAVSNWPQFARTIRGSTMVEAGKDYVSAAKLVGLSRRRIMLSHILPNVLGPILVIATLNMGAAIVTEATLSFLGVGVPPTQPSLGTLIRIGNEFLFSGEWWITVLPGAALVVLVLSVNLIGDWLRDALNPKLR